MIGGRCQPLSGVWGQRRQQWAGVVREALVGCLSLSGVVRQAGLREGSRVPVSLFTGSGCLEAVGRLLIGWEIQF